MVENSVDNYQIKENNSAETQINNFPKTTKFLEKLKNEDKKNTVEQVLGTGELKKLFENDSQYRKKCYEELKDCENDENVVRSIILAHLPEEYAYDVLIGDIVKVEIKNDDFVGSDVVDKKEAQKDKDIDQKDKDIDQKDKDIEQKDKDIEQKEEKKVQNDEAMEQKDEVIEQKENNKEKIEKAMKIAMDARNRLAPEGSELDNLTKEGTQRYNITKQSLEKNGIIGKLKDAGFDDGSINDYVILCATFQEIKNNAEYHELLKGPEFGVFYIAMKQLNNACNIPDTTINSFSDRNINNTRLELFYDKIGNKGLIEQKQRNMDAHSTEYEKLFSVDDDKLLEVYGRFLDGEGKKLYENFDNLNDTDREKLFDYVKNKKIEIDMKTKDLVEELCMTSQIKGILNCVPKKYSKKFQFNKANEISMDQNGIFQLDGHVNGIDFSLKQNLNDVNARLQTSTMLFREQDGNLNFTGKYKDSPFILPTSAAVFNTAISSLTSSELSEIQDQENYFYVMENLILKNMDKLYADIKYANNYVDSEIKSEENLHDIMGIFQNIGGGNIENLSKIDNGKLYDFFDTIHFNLNAMTFNEKKQFKDCLNILGNKIAEGGNIAGSDQFVKDEYLAKFLGSKEQTQKEMKGFVGLSNESSFFDFFDFFLKSDERNELGNRQILDVHKLTRCLNDDLYTKDLREDTEQYRMSLDPQI